MESTGSERELIAQVVFPVRVRHRVVPRALGVVDELDVNVFVGELDRHAGAHRGAGHLLADAPTAQLTESFLNLRSHVRAATAWTVAG